MKKTKTKATFAIDRIEGSKYYLRSAEDTVYEVICVTISEGKAELKGLPKKLA